MCVAVVFQKCIVFIKSVVDCSGENVNRTASTAQKVQESFQLILYRCIISITVRSQILLDGAVNGGAVEFHHSGTYY